MERKHEGFFRCGYCQKETPLSDEKLLELIGEEKPVCDKFSSPCSCGHTSYCSSIQFKAVARTKDWKGIYGKASLL